MRSSMIIPICMSLFATPFAVSGCGGDDDACGPTKGEITEVTDGDTIKVTTEDEETITVRLLLTDTPETTKGKEECYGQKAKALTKSFLFKRVKLSYESGDSCTDMYGRYLAYVTPAGESQSINEQLVAGGFARVCRIGCDESKYDEFADLEAAAQESELGLWNTETCPDGYNLASWGASGCNRKCK